MSAGAQRRVFVEAGGGTAQLEGEALPLAPGSLVNVPPGHVHGFKFAPLTGRLLAELALDGRTTVSAFEQERAAFGGAA